MSTEPEFMGKRCPPCSGDCRQGRDCDAEADELDVAQFWAAIVCGLCLLAAVATIVWKAFV